MRYLKFLLPLAVVAAVFNYSEAQSSAKKLPPDLFQKALKTTTDELLIDVRTPAEFAAGHLKEAINIDFKADDFRTQLERLDKAKPVFIYCAVGGRSQKAAVIFSEVGFASVSDLLGGFNGWKKEGKEVAIDQPTTAPAAGEKAKN